MFASPAPAAEIEEVVYETTDGAGDFGPVVFVTALIRHEARERETRESHVFLLRENLHLHDIVFAPLGRDEAAASLADAVRATHALFAGLVAKRGAAGSILHSGRVSASAGGDEGAEAGAGLRYATRRLAAHPFHEFRVRGQFQDAMWEIQDWSVSPALREALGRVTRYRADAGEAEVLRRIFAGG